MRLLGGWGMLGLAMVAGGLGVATAEGPGGPTTPDPKDAAVQFRLAVAYANGRGVAKDAGEAVRWFRKAAEQGHAGAQYDLGIACAKGLGTAKDDAEAMKWFRRAAEQGDPRAQVNLALGYLNGLGGTKDEFEGVAWLNVAAALSSPRAAELHERMEARLARPALVAAHQRCMELLKGLRKPPPAAPAQRGAGDGAR